MNPSVDDLLKLPGITVERYSQVEGCIFFESKIDAAQVNCYRCSQSSQELHRQTILLVRDLPAFEFSMEKLRELFAHIYQKFVIILLATQLAPLWKALTIKLS